MLTTKRVALGAALLLGAGAAHAAPLVTNTLDATALANAIGGSGITISNASLTYNTEIPAATFTNGASSVGFGSGIVLTTGTTGCVTGSNNQNGCTGAGSSSSLKFDFTSTSGQVFFNYVFGSEEYTQYVGSGFNDRFELRLNGVNIAQLPGGGGIVSINNINCSSNSAFYRNNVDGESNQPAGCVNQNLDIQLDGLTTVLTASALVNPGLNTFEFFITDMGDSNLDSAVFIQGGSFSSEPPPTNGVPAPAPLALIGIAALGWAAVSRRA